MGKVNHMKEHVSNLTPKDFTTNQDIRWCPGCGDYSILKQVHMFKVFMITELKKFKDLILMIDKQILTYIFTISWPKF